MKSRLFLLRTVLKVYSLKLADQFFIDIIEFFKICGTDIKAFKAAVSEAKRLAETHSSAEKKKDDGSAAKVMWAYTMPRIKAHMRVQFEKYAQEKDADLLATRALMKRQKANAKK